VNSNKILYIIGKFVKINEPLKEEDVWDTEFYTDMFASYYEDYLEGERDSAVDNIS